MMRVVVHAGFHKTGSTTLHKLLKYNKDLLPAGWVLLNSDAIQTKTLRELCISLGQGDQEAILAEIRLTFQLLLQHYDDLGTKVVVISSEDFAGIMPRPQYERRLYGLAPRIAEQLAFVAQPYDFSMYFFTRDKLSWLKSLHGHLSFWTPLRMSFEDVLERPKVKAFRWPRLKDELREATDGRVRFRWMSAEVEQAKFYGESFLQYLGLPDDIIDQFQAPPRKQIGPSQKMIDLVQSDKFACLPDDRQMKLKKYLVARRHKTFNKTATL